MFIFLIYSLLLYWGNVLNSNVTMKLAQLYYFLSQTFLGKKYLMSSPVQKLWGPCPPVNSVPAEEHSWARERSKPSV